VFKGSEILKLSELLKNNENPAQKINAIESPHIENLHNRSRDSKLIESYLAANDLFVFKKGSDIILVNRPNNETHKVTDLTFLAAHVFIDLKDTERIEQTNAPTQDVAFSTENSLDTDRKRKKGTGMKR